MPKLVRSSASEEETKFYPAVPDSSFVGFGEYPRVLFVPISNPESAEPGHSVDTISFNWLILFILFSDAG
jgi:hypothetical protein